MIGALGKAYYKRRWNQMMEGGDGTVTIANGLEARTTDAVRKLIAYSTAQCISNEYGHLKPWAGPWRCLFHAREDIDGWGMISERMIPTITLTSREHDYAEFILENIFADEVGFDMRKIIQLPKTVEMDLVS